MEKMSQFQFLDFSNINEIESEELNYLIEESLKLDLPPVLSSDLSYGLDIEETNLTSAELCDIGVVSQTQDDRIQGISFFVDGGMADDIDYSKTPPIPSSPTRTVSPAASSCMDRVPSPVDEEQVNTYHMPQSAVSFMSGPNIVNPHLANIAPHMYQMTNYPQPHPNPVPGAIYTHVPVTHAHHPHFPQVHIENCHVNLSPYGNPQHPSTVYGQPHSFQGVPSHPHPIYQPHNLSDQPCELISDQKNDENDRTGKSKAKGRRKENDEPERSSSEISDHSVNSDSGEKSHFKENIPFPPQLAFSPQMVPYPAFLPYSNRHPAPTPYMYPHPFLHTPYNSQAHIVAFSTPQSPVTYTANTQENSPPTNLSQDNCNPPEAVYECTEMSVEQHVTTHASYVNNAVNAESHCSYSKSKESVIIKTYSSVSDATSPDSISNSIAEKGNGSYELSQTPSLSSNCIVSSSVNNVENSNYSCKNTSTNMSMSQNLENLKNNNSSNTLTLNVNSHYDKNDSSKPDDLTTNYDPIANDSCNIYINDKYLKKNEVKSKSNSDANIAKVRIKLNTKFADTTNENISKIETENITLNSSVNKLKISSKSKKKKDENNSNLISDIKSHCNGKSEEISSEILKNESKSPNEAPRNDSNANKEIKVGGDISNDTISSESNNFKHKNEVELKEEVKIPHQTYSNAETISSVKTKTSNSSVWEQKKSWSQLFKQSSDSASKQVAFVTPFNTKEFAETEVKYNKKEKIENMPACDAEKFKVGFELKKYLPNYKPILLQPKGLINKKYWCYVNAPLQALLACPSLYQLFQTLKKEAGTTSGNSTTPFINSMVDLSSEFKILTSLPKTNRKEKKKDLDHVKRLADITTDTPLEPVCVYNMLVNCKENEFTESKQQDAEEMLSCLLNGLHDEMVQCMKLASVNCTESADEVVDSKDSSNTGSEWQVQGPKKKSCITRSTHFNVSPISEIFWGQLRLSLQQQGQPMTANVQPFNTLPLDIQSSKVDTLKDALSQLVMKEEITGFTCSKTNQEITASNQVFFEELPRVLILHLKRFIYDKDGGLQKVTKKLQFPIDLELTKDLISVNNRGKFSPLQRKYKLFAVVHHAGKEATKGHYIADVFHCGYKCWIRYDDSNVRAIPETVLLKHEAPRVPYLLFYRRCDTLSNECNGDLTK